ncbi:hypothetical protein ACOJUR_15820 [Alicyclobacillus tolerans]|uniref:hypothetical protein n=1 Tax=Alicyclobacillus TaxID=29330 RepID=UPI00193474F7|nr:hypothetical protein [Alicyclobacillus sp. TC]
MDMFRVVESFCNLIVAILNTCKAWIEWQTVKKMQEKETGENGDGVQPNPRS